ncbi:uncharacterized protein TRIADDRAFT_28582, partial [Trichoplax adhaerens]
TLEQATQETARALDLCFNNKFKEAEIMLKPRSETSMYHALSYGTIMNIQAMMTFQQEDIILANKVLKSAVRLCNRFRHKESFVGSVVNIARKKTYENYSDVEIHAELCYAECLLQRAILTFIQDETLMSFIKGGIKIRNCYSSYKECMHILKVRKNGTDHNLDSNYKSGVHLGIGAFNLLWYYLDVRLLLSSEVQTDLGLRELNLGSNCHSLRSPLCSMITVTYHTLITFVLGTGEGDLNFAQTVLQPCLAKYPEAALFLYFAGRLHLVKGDIDKAIAYFHDSINSQDQWKQLHHVCYWELFWCSCFRFEWREAANYAEILYNESRWSKAMYMYQKAACLSMIPEVPDEETRELFLKVPSLKQRIAGKSVPVEKFVIRKSRKYVNDPNGKLPFPAVELLYAWNTFLMIRSNKEIIKQFLDLTENVLEEIEKTRSNRLYVDEWCLGKLVQGVCFRYLEQEGEAVKCFVAIKEREDDIVLDHYVAAYSYVEWAMIYFSNGQYNQAKKKLEETKKNYKNYSLESRLHFRIHSALEQIKAVKNSQKKT